MADYNSSYTGIQIDTAVGKALNPDTTVVAGSSSLVTSGAVASALASIDPTITNNTNTTLAGVLIGANSKVAAMSIDSAVQSGSSNLISSGAVASALQNVDPTITENTDTTLDGVLIGSNSKVGVTAIDSAVTSSSSNLITSGAVASALDTHYVIAGASDGSTLGQYATAEGYNVQATASYAHAEGYYTKASNIAAHAEGNQSKALGNNSHAEGYGTTASGNYSHAEGYSTIASGNYSHAEGYGTIASGSYSHAEGQDTIANGMAAHAEGKETIASGTYSHAEGYKTIAKAVSHAEGQYTTASGQYSHAEGNHTVANHGSQHVFGEYNIPDPSEADSHIRGNYVEIVGNGADDSNLSNARTLDWNGNEVLAGKLTVGAAPNSNMDVTTKQYVDTGFSERFVTVSTTASAYAALPSEQKQEDILYIITDDADDGGYTKTEADNRFAYNQNLLKNWYFAGGGGFLVPSGTTYYSDTALTTSVGTTTENLIALSKDSSYATININSTDYYVAIAAVKIRGLPISMQSESYGTLARSIYFINCWLQDFASSANKGTWALTTNGLQLQGNQNYSNKIRQPLYEEQNNYLVSKLVGKELTASILLSDGHLLTGTTQFTSGNVFWNSNSNIYHIACSLQSAGSFEIAFYQTPFTIVAVKLELGTQQTLARQENGVWILNDPIPSYSIAFQDSSFIHTDSINNIDIVSGAAIQHYGLSASRLTNPTDLNDIRATGIYGGTNVTNAPSQQVQYIIEHLNDETLVNHETLAVQKCYRPNGAIYQRNFWNNEWSDWAILQNQIAVQIGDPAGTTIGTGAYFIDKNKVYKALQTIGPTITAQTFLGNTYSQVIPNGAANEFIFKDVASKITIFASRVTTSNKKVFQFQNYIDCYIDGTFVGDLSSNKQTLFNIDSSIRPTYSSLGISYVKGTNLVPVKITSNYMIDVVHGGILANDTFSLHISWFI